MLSMAIKTVSSESSQMCYKVVTLLWLILSISNLYSCFRGLRSLIKLFDRLSSFRLMNSEITKFSSYIKQD